MGQLVRQKIPALFNGVSRQPASQRRADQVEDADNVTFSVVTGGFSKRAGAELVAEVTPSGASDALDNPAVYSYKRDENEAYVIAVGGGSLYVWNKQGQSVPVSVKTGAQPYLDGLTRPEDTALATLGDVTLVLNKQKQVQMDTAQRSASPTHSYGVVNFIQYVRARRYNIQIDYTVDGQPAESGSLRVDAYELDDQRNYSPGRGARVFSEEIEDAKPNSNWQTFTDGSDLFIRAATANGDVYDSFVVSVSDEAGGGSMRATSDYVASAEALSANAWGGMIARIGSDDLTDGSQYFEFRLVPEDGTTYPDRQVEYTADGSTARFAIPFAFGGRGGLSVTEDGVSTSLYYLDGDSALVFSTAPTSGTVVRISTQNPAGPSYGQGYWQATTQPDSVVQFDAETMPHLLVREADGTFIFGPADGRIKDSQGEPFIWSRRAVGDTKSVPEPDFVGRRLSGLGFHRSRLYFLADEYVCFSATDDTLNFWPESAAIVVDSDPFARTAGTRQVNVLQHAYPFRKALIVSSEQAQFEVSSPGALTPGEATIDESTAYTVEPRCAPTALGSQLYLATRNGQSADVLEYFYEDTSLTNTANRIGIHVEDYIPAPVIEMAADPVNGTLFARSATDPKALYVYRLYFEGNKKVQSAWGRWTFDARVLSVQVFDSHVWLLLNYEGRTFLSRIPLNDNETITGLPYPCRLDNWQPLRGDYLPERNVTRWSLPAPLAADVACVLGNDFGPAYAGREITLTGPETLDSQQSAVTATGDWSAADAYIGSRFTAQVIVSTQYLRDENGRVETAGRLQLRKLAFNYIDSAAFVMTVEPLRRKARSYQKGAVGGQQPGYLLAQPPVPDSGRVGVPVRSRADTVQTAVLSSEPGPFTITSADWLGFYNEVSRNK